MKSKLKQQNAITLVALIITIIVLLILAMVSIRLVMNGGIIDRAEKGTKAYSEAEVQEQIKLAHSEYQMHKFTNESQQTETEFLHSKLDQLYGASNVEITGTDPLMVKVTNAGNTYALKLASNGGTEKVELGPWAQSGTTITNSKTNQTLELGDTVYYNSGVTAYEGEGDNQGKWGILGVEDGKLLIMSKENVATAELEGKEGYLNGSTLLNNACSPFKNETYADSARSVKVEDINKITGYTPADPVTHSYTMENGYVKMDNETPSDWAQTFEDINGKKLPDDSPIEVTANYYIYGLTNYLTSGSKIHNLLNDNNNWYWLDSPYVYVNTGNVSWGFRVVYSDQVHEGELWVSSGGFGSGSSGARAVVSLKSDVKLSGSSESGWTIE